MEKGSRFIKSGHLILSIYSVCAPLTEKSSFPKREPAVNGEKFDLLLLVAFILTFIRQVERQVSLQKMVVAV